MSEQRRNKRKENLEMKKANAQKMVIGNVKIAFDDEKVVISTPYRKVIYMAKGYNQAYTNYSILFNAADENDAERKEYAKILLGLEMIPNFAHTDPDLTAKIMKLFIDSVGDMINKGEGISVGDDQTDESLNETLDVINEELETLLP